MFDTFVTEEPLIEQRFLDTDKMLKKIRHTIATIDQAEDLLEKFTKLPLHFHEPELEKAFLMVFGRLKVKRMEAKHSEEELLKGLERAEKSKPA